MTVPGHDDCLKDTFDSKGVLKNRRVLQVLVQMRLRRIAGIAALAEELAALYALARFHDHTPALQRPQDGNPVRWMLNRG